MVVNNAKAVALMRDLSDKLAKRFPATAAGLNSIRQAFDANGMPVIYISHNGNEAEGQPVAFVRIAQIDAVSKDVFGNSLNAYAPHQMQTAWELQATPHIGDTFVSHADIAAIEFEAIKTGVMWQKIELANGTAVTEANVNAATPVAALDELYWPLKNP